MTTDTDQPGQERDDDTGTPPNASPELQDAIRSIDAIGENAWGRDDDQDVTRDGAGNTGEDPAAADASLQDETDGNPDAP